MISIMSHHKVPEIIEVSSCFMLPEGSNLYSLLYVDSHLDDHNEEECDHSNHDNPEENSQLLCLVKPEESQHHNGIGDTGSNSQSDLTAPLQIISSRKSKDGVEASSPAVGLQKGVSDKDTC